MPWKLVEGLICREMHWTLTALRKEATDDVLSMWLMLNKYDEILARRGITD